MTATVAGSFLGVNGTIIGAAVASVVTVVGNAVYSHSIHQTRERVLTVPAVRRITPMPARVTPTPVAVGVADQPGPHQLPPTTPPTRAAWRRAGLAAAGVFAALLTLLTTVEVVSGRPLSDLLHGTSASGTTVFGSSEQAPRTAQSPAVAPVTVTRIVVPSVVTTTPTVTQTAPPVTVTPTPTATSTPGGTPTPTGSPGAPTP
ncbi:MAG TPA: hypothetical protein VGN35_08195 [Jatrophihabitantaceae bacterium]|nr:hypothetical protein [Jatrophihabitantaceae bacterium]